MAAASRGLATVVIGLGVALAAAPAPAAARQSEALPTSPQCPVLVADQPLSVSAPFSGTVRTRSDDDGRIISSSLLCAYGEGVTPAAELVVTWEGEGDSACAVTETAVAPSLDAVPFEEATATLAAGVGGACEPSAAGAVPWPALGGLLLAGVAAGGVWLRRRRSAAIAVAPTAGRGTEGPEPPDIRPVLALLGSADGRRFASTGAGRLAALAAVAYADGDGVGGDLAREGSLSVLTHKPGAADR